MEHIQQRFKVNIVYAIREITEHGKHEVDQIVMKQQLEQYCSNIFNIVQIQLDILGIGYC